MQSYYLKQFQNLLKVETNTRKQNEEEATFASNIKREQEKIDWTQAGEEIYNHIRGLNPWPVAYTTFEWDCIKNLASFKNS